MIKNHGLRLLADENIEQESVKQLRSIGHDVFWLVTDGPGLLDDYIPSLMEKENRILNTHDVDFVSALRLSGRLHNGAVLVRAHYESQEWIANAVNTTLIGREDWKGRIAVIKPNGIRYTPHE